MESRNEWIVRYLTDKIVHKKDVETFFIIENKENKVVFNEETQDKITIMNCKLDNGYKYNIVLSVIESIYKTPKYRIVSVEALDNEDN